MGQELHLDLDLYTSDLKTPGILLQTQRLKRGI